MKRITPAERDVRIRELWRERHRDKRTEDDVVNFYYWLSQHEPGLVPEGAGAYQQLLTIIGTLPPSSTASPQTPPPPTDAKPAKPNVRKGAKKR